MSEEGLEAIAGLAHEGIKTNCTLIFSSNQGLLAAKAGASLLSPFVGRLDDINEDGMNVVRDLVAMVKTHDLKAEVLAASIRHPRHMTEAALAGANIATVPHKILRQMIHHPLTDTGILQFRRDWATVQKPSRHKKLDDAPFAVAVS
jgi:transaldolase